MTRRKFDPSKMTGPRPAKADPPSGARPMTVSELAWMVDASLKAGLPKSLRVVGEIGSLNQRTHWYFNLKDDQALVSCVMFATAARKVGFTPAEGQQVVATGRVEFYPKQGRTQLYVEHMEIVGAGALEARLRALIEDIRARGWLDPHRKRPLPSFPRRVAVITSRAGAALHDVLDTMRRRCPAVEVSLIDVRVQGDGAADQVAAAIRWVSEHHESLGIDALIVTRGGGSAEDLWAFNELSVADAIVRCSVPVVAAIGHETDVTVAELVADERAATPTQAAMRLTPDRVALTRQVAALHDRLTAAARDQIDSADLDLARHAAAMLAAVRHHTASARAHADRLALRLALRRPEAVLAARRAAVAQAAHRFHHAARTLLDRARSAQNARAQRHAAAMSSAITTQRDRIAHAQRELAIVGPASVLHRGYSVTLRADGSAVRTASDVRVGETIHTRLANGSLRSTVTARDAAEAPPAPTTPPLTPRPAIRRSPPRGHDPSQMDLFH